MGVHESGITDPVEVERRKAIVRRQSLAYVRDRERGICSLCGRQMRGGRISGKAKMCDCLTGKDLG